MRKRKEKIIGLAFVVMLFSASGIDTPDGGLSMPNVILCGISLLVILLANIGGQR